MRHFPTNFKAPQSIKTKQQQLLTNTVSIYPTLKYKIPTLSREIARPNPSKSPDGPEARFLTQKIGPQTSPQRQHHTQTSLTPKKCAAQYLFLLA